MKKSTMSIKFVPHTKQIIDPLMLKAYAEALEHKERWQASIDQIIRELLGLKGNQPLEVPSVDEIRKEMNRYIPENEKLSDLIIAMREE